MTAKEITAEEAIKCGKSPTRRGSGLE